MCAYAMQPKTFKLDTSGFLLYHLSYGVVPVVAVTVQFLTYVAVATASPQ